MRVVISLQAVTKSFVTAKNKVVHALRGVTLDIYRGEVLSLLGINGAGKTTLSSIIGALTPASSGKIVYQGQDIYQDPAWYRSKVGFCPQKANFNPYLTMEQNLYYAGLFFGLSEDLVNQRIQELMQEFDCERYKNALVDELSGGYKQRFLLIRSLLHRPEILILDEPTVALDPQVRRQLWMYIKKLKQEGLAIILTTHYLEEAEELSDRVCLLDKGIIQLVDSPENLKQRYQKHDLESVFIELLEQSK